MGRPATEESVSELRDDLSAAAAQVEALQVEVSELRAQVSEFKQWQAGVEAVWPQIVTGGA